MCRISRLKLINFNRFQHKAKYNKEQHKCNYIFKLIVQKMKAFIYSKNKYLYRLIRDVQFFLSLFI